LFRRVSPYSIDCLWSKAGLPGNLCDAHTLIYQVDGEAIAFPIERGLAATKFRAIIRGLCMGDSGSLGLFDSFGLSLSHSGHEAYQRVSHGLCHWFFGRAIECEIVDNRPNDDPAPNELTHAIRHVRVISPEPVDPADNEHVATAEQIEQPLPLIPLGEAGRHA
jgi:hypothetical protein